MPEILKDIDKSFNPRRFAKKIRKYLKADFIVLKRVLEPSKGEFETVYADESYVSQRGVDPFGLLYVSEHEPEFFKKGQFPQVFINACEILKKKQGKLREAIVVPIWFDGKFAGLIYLFYQQDIGDRTQILRRIKRILPEISLILGYLNLYNEANVITDRFTRLPSVSYFWKRLDEEFNRARRYGRYFSVLIVDIDDLKRINDYYGHRAGDELLKLVGEFLKNYLRSSDIITRFGGDEFALILPETAYQGAYTLSENLRNAIESHIFPVSQTSGIRITVSIAGASYPQLLKPPDEFIKEILLELQRIKREGGNSSSIIRE